MAIGEEVDFSRRVTITHHVAVVMGSQSDWPTMQHATKTLESLGVAYGARIISAHRTPERLFEFAKSAISSGVRVIIAGAGGAAHLPGMIASMTTLPVLGVPVETRALGGLDSLYSIVQMPGGVPVATFAIGKPGAINAALHAAAIFGLFRPEVQERLIEWRRNQTESVAEVPVDEPQPTT